MSIFNKKQCSRHLNYIAFYDSITVNKNDGQGFYGFGTVKKTSVGFADDDKRY